MFVYFIFDGIFICRFLPILRPPPSLGVTLVTLKNKAFTLIIDNLYLQILHSASVNRIR